MAADTTGAVLFHPAELVAGLPLLAEGLLFTLALSMASFAAALIFGTLLGLLRGEVGGWPGRLAACYIEGVRGTPLVMLLILIHYGVLSPLLGGGYFFVSALTSFILFESACVGEIVRGGLISIDPAERESAICLGLSRWQQWRLVLLPIALRRMSPALVGQFVSLIKDTSLAAVIGVVELTRAGEIIYERTYHDFEILLLQALIYFCLCFSVARLGRRFEPTDRQPKNILARNISE